MPGKSVRHKGGQWLQNRQEPFEERTLNLKMILVVRSGAVPAKSVLRNEEQRLGNSFNLVKYILSRFCRNLTV